MKRIEIAFATLFAATAVETAERPVAVEIPAQPLGQALDRLAGTTGLQLLYDPEAVNGKRSSAVSGRYTPRQAAERLLAGSGLEPRFTGERSAAIRTAAARLAEGQTEELELPAIPVEDSAARKALAPESAYETRRSYSAPRAANIGKTDTPLLETPQSIQVIPRAVIEDHKYPRIKDALENVSGVRPSPSLGTGSNFIIRGFANGNRIYRNGLGLINGFGGMATEFDTANLESIEVLKGPSSMFYGRAEPGGLINVTTKAPLADPYYSLEQQFGSYDYYRTVWDAGGPVTGDQSLLYRFSGSYQDNNSFRDFVSLQQILVSPSITWKISDATQLTVNVEGFDRDFKADYGQPAIGNRPAPIPIGRSMDDPNTPMANDSHVYFNTDFVHRFSQEWAIHHRFLASWADNHSTFATPAPSFGSALQADNRTLGRNLFRQESTEENYTTNLDITGKLELWETRHELLVGFDYTQGNSKYAYFGDYNTPNPALNLDIFNPSYGIPDSLYASTLAAAAGDPNNFSYAKTEWWGLYFQDHITLWDKLHVMGGGRYDWAEKGRAFAPTFAAAEKAFDPTVRKDDAFSPRVGLLYEATDWLSVYGNWTNSFGNNNGIDAQGRAQPPETAEQFEAGLKTELFDRRFSGTLAYYHLTKQNILTPNLATADPFDSIAIGEARSQGIELDMTGKITEDLSLIASYAYTDARVTRDNSGLQGNRLLNVPEHSGSVWLRHDLKAIPQLDGLSWGVGAYLAGQREGDNENTFQLPGYVRLDTYAAYSWKLGPSRLTAQLNVRNVLDKRYYESTDPNNNVATRLGIYPGAPLTLLGSLRVEF